jgi:hypothetical protein
MLLDSRRFVWLGTGDKLVRFDYRKVRRNARAPVVIIQRVRVNSENISWHSLKRVGATKAEIEKTGNIPAYVSDELSTYGKMLTVSERDTLLYKFSDIDFDNIAPFNAIPENLRLPFSLNSISFDFVGIETSRPFLMQYQYMLEGFDNLWSVVSDRSIADYRNLPQVNILLN